MPQARHQFELQAGLYGNGLGMRLTADYQSASLVRGTPTQKGAIRSLPWLSGARVTLEAANLFNARRRVVDEGGLTPQALQPAYLDPLGRTIRFSLRMLF